MRCFAVTPSTMLGLACLADERSAATGGATLPPFAGCKMHTHLPLLHISAAFCCGCTESRGRLRGQVRHAARRDRICIAHVCRRKAWQLGSPAGASWRTGHCLSAQSKADRPPLSNQPASMPSAGNTQRLYVSGEELRKHDRHRPLLTRKRRPKCGHQYVRASLEGTMQHCAAQYKRETSANIFAVYAL